MIATRWSVGLRPSVTCGDQRRGSLGGASDVATATRADRADRRGVYHAIVAVRPPVETLMIRVPSLADKRYREPPPHGE